MDPKHRTILLKHNSDLAEAIQHQIKNICRYLMGQGILAEPVKQRIECQGTPLDCGSELVDILPDCGPYAFETFYKACLRHTVWEAANILKPEKGDHYPRPPCLDSQSEDEGMEEASDDNRDLDLPEVWPTEEDKEEYKCREDVYIQKITDKKMKEKHRNSLKKGHLKIYPMRRKERGNNLIINIYEFDNPEWKREGSLADKKAMDFLFQKLGFFTIGKRNLNAEGMKDFLEEESRKDYTEHDCLIVFIMSHGARDKIFGKDGRIETTDGRKIGDGFLTIDQIVKPFLDVPTLKDKPKLFFIEACQIDGLEAKAPTDGNEVDAEPINISRKYSENNVLIVMSCIPGDESNRQEHVGSWFLMAIFYILKRFAHSEDLGTLLTWVRNLVVRCKADGVLKPQITYEPTQLCRQFYFFPGLYEEDVDSD